MDTGGSIKIGKNIDLVKISADKYKYVNSEFKKPQHKLSDHNTDIKLKVGNEFFGAHKDVLMATSDYFEAMFSHDMAEKGQDHVVLKGISAEGFRIMIEYMYHGFVALDTSNIGHCLEVTRYYHIDWLTHVCCNFLTRNLAVDNCLQILELADTHSLTDLSDDMYCFIGLNASQLMEQGKLSLFSYDVLKNLVSGRFYIDLSEEMVLSMIIEWINTDFQEREACLTDLLACVKFHLFCEEELCNLPGDITKYDEVKKRIDQAMDFQKAPYMYGREKDERLDARGECDVLVLFSQWDTSLIQIVDLERSYIHQEPNNLRDPFHILIDFTSITSLDNFLYSAGGINPFMLDIQLVPTNCFVVFDPRLRSWIPLQPMSRSRENFPLVTMNSKIYALGGNGLRREMPNQTLPFENSTNENASANQSSSEPPTSQDTGANLSGSVPEPTVVVNDEAGISADLGDQPHTSDLGDLDDTAEADTDSGHHERAVPGALNPEMNDAETMIEPVPLVLSRCERYDPVNNSWSDIPSLPFGLYAHAACTLDGSLYVSGGVTDSLSDPVPVNYCWRWMEGEDRWSRVTPMNTRRQSHAMFSHNKKIYVMGGYTAGDLTDLTLEMQNCQTIEIYDVETESWETLCEYGKEFGHLHRTVALVNDVAYILGGSYSSKYLHEFHIKSKELLKGAFCGKDFIKVTRLNMAYPRLPTSATTTKVL